MLLTLLIKNEMDSAGKRKRKNHKDMRSYVQQTLQKESNLASKLTESRQPKLR